MAIGNIFKLIIFSFVGTTLFFFAEKLSIQETNDLIEFQNVEPTKIFNLLLALWFIAWLLESFLEILQSMFQIKKSKVKIEQFTAIVGFLIGLIIAYSGVHTIRIFFDFGENLNNHRKFLFDLMDAILTAGVIAGGSKGIHELTNAYKGIMETIKNTDNINTNNQSNLSNQPTSTNADNQPINSPQ